MIKQRISIVLTLAVLIAIVFCAFVLGITWGLPSRSTDPYLFGNLVPWSGGQIADLVRADQRWRSDRGSDVDANPAVATSQPITLNDTDEKRAAILLRYRLYTYQPDEMTVMMALRSTRPSEGDFDPKLYQYGGLFLYPLGATLKLCGMLKLIHITSDLAYYLDRPEEFARFYIVARAYVVAWAIAGMAAVFLIARRLIHSLGSEQQANLGGILAAILYALLPVVVNMSHEAKPHLPATVLMLFAVLCAARYIEQAGLRWAIITGITCGAAFGTVLSSLPIFVLLPLMVLLRPARWSERFAHAAVGIVAGIATYCLTNPYIPINLVHNREVLRSNFGNSLAMYQIDRLADGLWNVIVLMGEGLSPITAILSVACVAYLLLCLQTCNQNPERSPQRISPQRISPDRADSPDRTDKRGAGPAAILCLLLTPAVLIFVQFVALGAGKPGEYGRFALFPDITLAIAVAVLASRLSKYQSALFAGLVISLTSMHSFHYASNFHADCGNGSRIEAAQTIQKISSHVGPMTIGVFADPAPYCMPPVDLFRNRLVKLPRQAAPSDTSPLPDMIVTTTDDMAHAPVEAWIGPYTQIPQTQYKRTRISWANKPITILLRNDLHAR